MRHPLHAAFVHFPLALLGTSLAFDGTAMFRGTSVFWAVSFWNIALGLALSLITAATGLFDSARAPLSSAASATVTRHMIAVSSGLSCYGLALFARGGASVPTGKALVATLALEVLGFALLALGGWLGGELVYRHGVGRASEKS
jgi:uncharacterized membrane protein